MPWRSDNACPTARPWETANGFTLIELLVVLAIIALLLLVVPQATAGLPSFRLHAAAAKLADTLRQLRDDAIRTGRTTTLMLDVAHVRYLVTGIPSWQPLPAVVEAAKLSRDLSVCADAVTEIRFFADGSASGGLLTLRHANHTAAISIEWLTGRVVND